jgi:maltose alpha-D-glucosyltransferase/alpha-amylase
MENQGDAWSVTSAYLDRYVEEQRLLTAEPAAQTDDQLAYLRLVRQIGRRTAEMQNAFASRDDIEAFAPEPISAEDMHRWRDRLLAQAAGAIDELERRKAALREADRPMIETLIAHAETLPRSLGRLLPADAEALKIRQHGDFHLGQILIVRDDVVFIDFEGEPRRPLEERRCKVAAARDLAGLLRSIDYSAMAALNRMARLAAEDHGKVEQALQDWRERAVEAVLDAYRQALAESRLWPSDRAKSDGLLDFFLLEKAFYEIAYELAHRPDWVRVPLAGTCRILDRLREANS